MKPKIIAIVGEAGTGKDTLLQNVIQKYPDKFNKIISYTTRPRRENETNGKDYYFISEKKFNQTIMLEQTCFNNWKYGTPLSSLSPYKLNIGTFNPSGVQSLEQCSVFNLVIIKLIASDKIRLLRQLQRENNPNVDEIIRRYHTDKEDFKNFIEQDFTLRNETLEDLKQNVVTVGQLH